MKQLLMATVAAGMMAVGGAPLALAQTTTPSTPNNAPMHDAATAPTNPMSHTTPMPGTMGANGTNNTAAMSSPTNAGATPAMTTPNTTGPALGANSQVAPKSDSSAPAAVTTTSAASRTTKAPVAGANSFTQAEARGRIQDRGFANVTNLKKDAQGIWRGTAMKDGKSVQVALDYQGNITSN